MSQDAVIELMTKQRISRNKHITQLSTIVRKSTETLDLHKPTVKGLSPIL